jgi:hypothetical protein
MSDDQQGKSQQTEKNSISDVRRFFTEGEPALKQGEFLEFWKSLTDEDKAEFLNADLS